MLYTDNPNYFPTVIMLGSFLVPVVFVTFVYERKHSVTVPPTLVAVTFLWGGAVGVVVAGFLEYEAVRDLSAMPLLAIGLIEEGAKLIVPLAIFLSTRYRREAEGLVLGAAAGMGFAALETMGYGFVALIKSQGSVGVLEDTLIIRGFLAPVGHGAWTAAVCGILWRERELGRSFPVAALNVLAAFALIVSLHAAWDGLAGIRTSTQVEFAGVEGSTLVVAAVSLLFFVHRMREVKSLAAVEQPKAL
ncbi:MAG TPA: PrsW family glutamic-type intramembrane protease [Dehalococcoidia bacterium]|nr:PrsW family glutamic-type intramembrane protease [Dehalococcoidia bacterium]